MIVKNIGSGTGDALAVQPNSKLVLWGYAMSETASSASTAEVILRHGVTATAEMIVPPLSFDANGVAPPIFFPRPINCPGGIYVDRVSGETIVCLYIDYQ